MFLSEWHATIETLQSVLCLQMPSMRTRWLNNFQMLEIVFLWLCDLRCFLRPLDVIYRPFCKFFTPLAWETNNFQTYRPFCDSSALNTAPFAWELRVLENLKTRQSVQCFQMTHHYHHHQYHHHHKHHNHYHPTPGWRALDRLRWLEIFQTDRSFCHFCQLKLNNYLATCFKNLSRQTQDFRTKLPLLFEEKVLLGLISRGFFFRLFSFLFWFWMNKSDHQFLAVFPPLS